MTPRISVIMPVYNCAPYLSRAMQSVLSQGVDLEVIAIEDHSRDASAALLCTLAAEEPRIRAVYHTENAGVGAVRNEALALATGEFVAFCDADDCIPEGAYKALLAAIEGKDMAIGSFDDVYDDGRRQHCPLDPRAEKQPLRALFSVCCLWTKLIRRSFLSEHHLLFEEDMTIGEDVVFLGRLLRHAPVYELTPHTVYEHWHYPLAENKSLTHTHTAANFALHVLCRERLASLIGEIPGGRDYVYLDFTYDLCARLLPVEDREERRAAFSMLRDYFSGYDYAEHPLHFLGMAGVEYDRFCEMDADAYFTYIASRTPRERVADEFRTGGIGFRWILIYLKHWLSFKLRRRNE